MNTANLKRYAPQARREFITAISKQLNQLGIYSDKQISDVKEEGSVLLIEGKAFTPDIRFAREKLVKKVKLVGYAQLVEQEAYTWFNRLCAIRYMEIHDYLGHGLRVLSHPDNPTGFEIIDHAVDAADELELDRDYIIELKLAGNKDETLYRRLLLKQCHKLHEAMPFLFEALNDATELLLPDNLTRTDSILRGLVDSIPEEDWDQVEVIGWLYQFYISEKKDEVMGKVVKSEDIPAATQLFTPNWIVKYLVQNSVGRQWLQTYPESTIKAQMEYYIEPAEQSPEVNEQLQAITPDSINPESIKVLDPAVGSGHILIEAYNVLKAIYEERGFRPRDIPKSILENNLYGLDIDDRAAQLSGFALMMLARADDKRIFTRNVSLNVLALQEGNHINLPAVWRELNLSGGWDTDAPQDMFADETQDLSSFEADNRYQLLQRTLARFTHAKTFGSLIEVPADEYDGLKEMHETLSELAESGDSYQKPAAKQLIDIVHQALILSIRYDAVIANPPYMGSKNMSYEIKDYIKKNYPDCSSDLYSAFIDKGFIFCKPQGINAQVTLQTWMFLSGFSDLRTKIVSSKQIRLLMQIGYNSFPELNSKIVQCAAIIASNTKVLGAISTYVDLNKYPQSSDKSKMFFKAKIDGIYYLDQAKFQEIPGHPIAYWISDKLRSAFSTTSVIEDIAPVRQGFQTGDNDRFLRFWYEIGFSSFTPFAQSKEELWASGEKWVPYNKGGGFRKWYGNNEYVVSLDESNYSNLAKMGNCLPSRKLYFKRSITWSALTSSHFGARYSPDGFTFSAKGACAFPANEVDLAVICSLLNSEVAKKCLEFLAPTLDFNVGDIRRIPVSISDNGKNIIQKNFTELLSITRDDWNDFETSWNFSGNPLLNHNNELSSLALENYIKKNSTNTAKIIRLESENNKLFAEFYGLSNEINITPQLDAISLTTNPVYRYGKGVDDLSLIERFQSDTISELVSYSLGCMLGRYSLDREGLVYANLGNKGFDELVADGAYKSFPADQNAIIPLTDQEWFKDDATDRLREFVQVVWGSEHLQENLDFIAESLCLHAIKPKKSESALETIRRYLSTQFYKDHLKTYKKRPIYWLFSSGKNKAFECLVYLHRYNEGTLSRMRTEYVTPLLGKYDAYAEQLDKQIDSADSTSDANRFKKELAALVKKQVELREFDDKLKHYADMRISLDLDDGVKANYGKFGDLLSDVKSITGSAPEVI